MRKIRIPTGLIDAFVRFTRINSVTDNNVVLKYHEDTTIPEYLQQLTDIIKQNDTIYKSFICKTRKTDVVDIGIKDGSVIWLTVVGDNRCLILIEDGDDDYLCGVMNVVSILKSHYDAINRFGLFPDTPLRLDNVTEEMLNTNNLIFTDLDDLTSVKIDTESPWFQIKEHFFEFNIILTKETMNTEQTMQ